MPFTATDMTLADLLQRFGPIPAARIRYDPPPGAATEQDVIALEAQERLFELVDGVLVEKAVGFCESFLAIRLARFLSEFVEQHNLGIVAGADGMLRLAPGLVRIPDVSFIPWPHLPQGRIPRPIPDLDSRPRARLSGGGDQRGQYGSGDGAKAARLFCRRQPPRLVCAAPGARGPRLYGARSIHRSQHRSRPARRAGVAGVCAVDASIVRRAARTRRRWRDNRIKARR